MSFDNSRSTFNPWNDYFGVVMQQGRVQLDSDWNELIAELTRRIQAGTMDILGLTGVPSTTPYAFRITPTVDSSGGRHLSIGCGRIYVDGILAENHGLASSAQWDPALGEWSGAPQLLGIGEIDSDFGQQIYLPGATVPTAGTVFIAYLDVWQRAVTSVEDPNLVEKAVGVDTTGRFQTVWQLKLVDISGVAGISGAIPLVAIAPWLNAAQPSISMLTTSQVPSASSGPCALGPATGFTGLENQFYRVEIHQAGVAQLAGATAPIATFKWSRENASVCSLVTAISSVTNSANKAASQLTVQSMGRDQVLGFNPGDWIEVIDDHLEFSGQPGELHQIDSINSTARTVTLDAPVNAANFNATDSTRHTRIQRWDQTGAVYESDGVTVWANLSTAGSTGIPVPPPGTSLILENGITVSFNVVQPANLVGAQYTPIFKTGDFWNFAARTADGSVESLAAAPSLGIHHHYSRVAIVNFSGTPTATDCRQLFPSLANPAIHITNVIFSGTGGQILNDATYTIQQLTSGISVVCDTPIDPAVITAPTLQAAAWNATTAYSIGQYVTLGGNYYICIVANTGQTPPGADWAIVPSISRICSVTVDIPTTAAGAAGGGYDPLILSATLTVGPSTINWTPTPAAQAALSALVLPTAPPALGRLTLKGNCIWAQGNPGVFLNGATVGYPAAVSGSNPTTNLQLPTGDGRNAADFDMWFWLVSVPPIVLTPSGPLIFANQAVGTTSAAQTVVLTYNGTTPLTLAFSQSGDFAETNNFVAALPKGGTCTINITFTPTTFGVRSGQITITASGISTPLVITLTGTGLAPQLTSSPAALTFPAVVVANTSAAQIVTLTNTGNSPLTISAIQILGTDPADFSETSTCMPSGTGTWLPGQSCAISVQFKPTVAGLRTAVLDVTHNAPGSPLAVPLSGTGVLPKTTEKLPIEKVKIEIIKPPVLTLGTASATKLQAAEASGPLMAAFITPEERPAG